jgi:hypothetical protein
MDRSDAVLLKLIEKEERELMDELEQLLDRIKRECSPEFAARVETYLRQRRLLPGKADN